MKKKILLVDDEPDLTFISKAGLEGADYALMRSTTLYRELKKLCIRENIFMN